MLKFRKGNKEKDRKKDEKDTRIRKMRRKKVKGKKQKRVRRQKDSDIPSGHSAMDSLVTLRIIHLYSIFFLPGTW